METNNGDSSPGDSGGPFFAWWADGNPYIVGEVSGQEEEYIFPFSFEDNNIAAAGSPMVDLIILGHQQLAVIGTPKSDKNQAGSILQRGNVGPS